MVVDRASRAARHKAPRSCTLSQAQESPAGLGSTAKHWDSIGSFQEESKNFAKFVQQKWATEILQLLLSEVTSGYGGVLGGRGDTASGKVFTEEISGLT